MGFRCNGSFFGYYDVKLNVNTRAPSVPCLNKRKNLLRKDTNNSDSTNVLRIFFHFVCNFLSLSWMRFCCRQ